MGLFSGHLRRESRLPTVPMIPVSVARSVKSDGLNSATPQSMGLPRWTQRLEGLIQLVQHGIARHLDWTSEREHSIYHDITPSPVKGSANSDTLPAEAVWEAWYREAPRTTVSNSACRHPSRSTCVWVDILIVATPDVYASSILLDESYNFVQVAQWQIIALQKSLSCRVWVLCRPDKYKDSEGD